MSVSAGSLLRQPVTPGAVWSAVYPESRWPLPARLVPRNDERLDAERTRSRADAQYRIAASRNAPGAGGRSKSTAMDAVERSTGITHRARRSSAHLKAA